MEDEASSIWTRRNNEKSAFLSSAAVRPRGEANDFAIAAGNNNDENQQQTEDLEIEELDTEGRIIVKPWLGTQILENSWIVWFMHRGPGVKIHNYELATKQVGTFSTVEEFWQVYSHLRRLDKLAYTSEFQVFRKGIKPMWEDPANAQGGKWVVRFRRLVKNNENSPENGEDSDAVGNTSKRIAQSRFQARLYWERILIAMVGGMLGTGGKEQGERENGGGHPIHHSVIGSDEILGLVVSVRRDEDILSVWNKRGTGEDSEAMRQEIQREMKRVLQLPQDISFEYKVHSQSIKEGAEKQALYSKTDDHQKTHNGFYNNHNHFHHGNNTHHSHSHAHAHTHAHAAHTHTHQYHQNQNGNGSNVVKDIGQFGQFTTSTQFNSHNERRAPNVRRNFGGI